MSKGAAGQTMSGLGAAASSMIKLSIGAGQATASPPIGPALGQKGVKAIDFCKQFNEATKKYVLGTPLLTRITVNSDRTFQFEIKSPSVSYLLKKASGVATCSTSKIVGQICPQQLYEIAKLKVQDPNLTSMGMERIFKSLVCYARQLGFDIVPVNAAMHETS